MNKKNIKIGFHIFLMFILACLLVGSFYLKFAYANESVEEFYFYLTNGVGNSDSSVFWIAFKNCIIFVILFTIVLISIFYNNFKIKDLYLNIKKLDKKIKIYPIDFVIKRRKLYTIIMSLIFIFISLYNIRLFDYIKNNIFTSTFIEDNVTIINKDDVIFENGKKNLIYIFVESLETTFFTKDQGGDWDYEVISELYDLLEDDDSIYFSSGDKAEGMLGVSGTTWTTASVVSNSTGFPFKVPVEGNSYKNDDFMNGAYSLGDVLKDNGYINEVISGSDLDFGGLEEFFTKHGYTTIIDSRNSSDYGLEMTKDSKGAWGINDKYLLELAKNRILELASSGTPFNETILTIDTHHIDGFKGSYTLNKYKTQYENVYATTSSLLYDFVSWIKNQDFYDNTMIVIVGDHPSMQSQFFKNNDANLRRRYNVFINSSVSTDNTKNRDFSSLDTYPTIIAGLGGTIPDNKIGLGVNLFSSEKTLIEQYGIKYVNKELDKKSIYYNDAILGDYEEYLKKRSESMEKNIIK